MMTCRDCEAMKICKHWLPIFLAGPSQTSARRSPAWVLAALGAAGAGPGPHAQTAKKVTRELGL